MRSLPDKVFLIIPCYNEEKRLNLNKFQTTDLDCTFLFVDDGSVDDTARMIAENEREDILLLRLEKNSGKAEAIRQGVLYLKTLPVYNRVDWVGYWDADLATPLSEISCFIRYANEFGDNDIQAILGSRVLRLGSEIERTPIRHYLGRVFATAAGLLLKTNCYDTQCGAKLFKKEILDIIFSEKFISRWIFDVEILLRLKEFKSIEYPLRFWKDVPGSKIKILSVGIRTLVELFKIRQRYRGSSAVSQTVKNVVEY